MLLLVYGRLCLYLVTHLPDPLALFPTTSNAVASDNALAAEVANESPFEDNEMNHEGEEQSLPNAVVEGDQEDHDADGIDEEDATGDSKINENESDQNGTGHIRRHGRHRNGQAFQRPTVIFFNMYMNRRETKRSYYIVQEQLRQVNESSHPRHGSVIRFNILGANISHWAAPDYARTVCGSYYPHLKCEFMNYYPNANEEVTLHAMWEHCQDHPRHRVTYLHNKGSYRKERGNTKIRRIATTSALSTACLRMPHTADYRCNMCGITFHTLPYFHWTANIWTAECKYIRDLVDPLQYEDLRWKMFQELWRNHADDAPCLPPLPSPESSTLDQLKEFGLGRYSMERWLLSHPHMLPCDVTPLRLARFERGFEKWFRPKLRESRKLTIETPLRNESTQLLYFLRHEHNQLYPNLTQSDVLMRYAAHVEPLQPCVPSN